MTPVTIVEVLPQTVLRHKTLEKEGYNALIVGVMSKDGKTIRKQKEFNVTPELLETFPVGHVFDESFFEDESLLGVQGTSKGK